MAQALDELRAEGLVVGGHGRGRPATVATTVPCGPATCVVCGRPIAGGDEHYPTSRCCTMAAHGWCDCDEAAHPECCPTCARGGAHDPASRSPLTPPWPAGRCSRCGPGPSAPDRELTAWESRATLDPERIRRWWTPSSRRQRRHRHRPGRAGGRRPRRRPARTNPDRQSCPQARSGLDVYQRSATPTTHAPGRPGLWRPPAAAAHLYFRAPADGGPWRNTAGRIGWHIDTRASRRLRRRLRLASSTAASTCSSTTDDPTELPAWLAELLTQPASHRRRTSTEARTQGRGYAPAALAGEVQRVLEAPPGQRNAALNRAAWNLARHIATGLLDRADVEAALQVAGEAAGGQTPAGVAATIRSAINARLCHGTSRAVTGADRR